MAPRLSVVIDTLIILFVIGVLAPISLTSLATATWTSVNVAVVSVFTVLLPILAAIGIAYQFYTTSSVA